MKNQLPQTHLNLCKLATWLTFAVFLLLEISAIGQVNSTFLSVEVNLDSDPDSVFVSVLTYPGYPGRIEISSLQDENNTQRVELYYKHCYPTSDIQTYDTSFAIATQFPYDLLLLTFLDTTIQQTSEPPVCVFAYESIVPLDTLLLTADQILSTDESEFIQNAVGVFPNPTQGAFHLDIPETARLLSVNLTDLTGRKIRAWEGQNTSLQIDFLPPGLYMLLIETSEGRAV
ncbi:MAG: T9SS type A sorting domain-containing protein, partial [Cryomorphaceae bacterium]